MLRFKRIEIENFAIFEHLEVEPSTDPDRRLTVIRAENGSGKTTFLRAVLWGMYGEKGIPGAKPEAYSVHPAWWRPDDQGIRTTVTIDFETDGSSRHDPVAGSRLDAYQLRRSVTTKAVNAAHADEPNFVRNNESRSLMKREDSGAWEEVPWAVGVDAVIEQLLPWGLRDFFVMDADKAVGFVGGMEGFVMSVHEVEQKTTAAVRSLLGIDVFEAAANRLRMASSNFGREATRAIKDHKLDELQAKQNCLEDREKQTKGDLDKAMEEARDRKGDLEECSQQLREELRHFGRYEPLARLREEAQKQLDTSRNAKREAASGLAICLADASLFAPLTATALLRLEEDLKPLHDAGRIPLQHIGFVRQLLERGECVCGQSLEGDAERRCRVEQELADSTERADEAAYLGHLYDAAVQHRTAWTVSNWSERRQRLSEDIAYADAAAKKAGLELRDVERKLDGIDEEKVKLLRSQEIAHTTQLEKTRQAVGRLEHEFENVSSELKSVRTKVVDAQRKNLAAADSTAARDLASLGAKILHDSVAELRERQVKDLSDRMNRLFGHMAANVTDADFQDEEEGRESVRMIARVGIRPVEDGRNRFEIFARNHHGRMMPPTEINGASRRVLALSFVLALCQESQTHAPFVADSLLNSMSGAVRRNTLKATVENSRQPILLLTGSDLEGEAETDTVRRFGGAVYTLTGQWDAVVTGGGGDVVRQTSSKSSVSVLCRCGPRQFCRVCERLDQRGRPGWSERTVPQETGEHS